MNSINELKTAKFKKDKVVFERTKTVTTSGPRRSYGNASKLPPRGSWETILATEAEGVSKYFMISCGITCHFIVTKTLSPPNGLFVQHLTLPHVVEVLTFGISRD